MEITYINFLLSSLVVTRTDTLRSKLLTPLELEGLCKRLGSIHSFSMFLYNSVEEVEENIEALQSTTVNQENLGFVLIWLYSAPQQKEEIT